MGLTALVSIGVLVTESMPVMMSGCAYSGRIRDMGSSRVTRLRSMHWRAVMVVRSCGLLLGYIYIYIDRKQ
jgi:hypothetical protein